MQQNTEWATIGKIVAPFGLRGELKVFSLSDIPDRFAQLEKVYIGPDYQPFPIVSVRPYKSTMVLLKLLGINNMSAAEPLRDRDIFIPMSELAELPPNEYYQHDILGLQVLKLDDTLVGTIVDIIPTGGNDVYTVKTTKDKQFLIPAVKAIVKQIDLVRHVMYIDPIPGLLDDEAVLDEQSTHTEEVT
ncbi:MAG: ribosome maturation factor RimM [Chloroflexota bacterium]|nr:ribosome maturation factor RimM [Chloroflexota bacterium]